MQVDEGPDGVVPSASIKPLYVDLIGGTLAGALIAGWFSLSIICSGKRMYTLVSREALSNILLLCAIFDHFLCIWEKEPSIHGIALSISQYEIGFPFSIRGTGLVRIKVSARQWFR